MPKAKYTRKERKTAREIFLSYVKFDLSGEVNTSGIFERNCYNDWLALRKRCPKRPGESFRRTLVAQVTGSDGRKPFPPAVERSVLQRLRQREPWPCFKGSKTKIGRLGFKRLGYHEKESHKHQNGSVEDFIELKLENERRNQDGVNKLEKVQAFSSQDLLSFRSSGKVEKNEFEDVDLELAELDEIEELEDILSFSDESTKIEDGAGDLSSKSLNEFILQEAAEVKTLPGNLTDVFKIEEPFQPLPFERPAKIEPKRKNFWDISKYEQNLGSDYLEQLFMAESRMTEIDTKCNFDRKFACSTEMVDDLEWPEDLLTYF